MVGWKWLLILVILIPFGAIAGCIDDPVQEGDLIFTDPLGAEVVLEDYPERIVTLSPSLTETVFALGIGEKVVATDDVSNYPPEAKDLPDVFSYLGIDLEKLLAADPDLVIMDKTLDISENAYNSIKRVGIPVYRIYPKTINDVLGSMMGIGNITGSKEKAEELVEDFLERMEAIERFVDNLEEEERPMVLLVTYYDGSADPWVSTDSTMTGGLVDKVGGANAISDDTGIVVQVGVEAILGSDPDFIFCTQSTVWPTTTRENILSDERWQDIEAVKNGRVFDIDGDIVDRTGPRLIEGLEEIHSHILDMVEE
jgi:iron complex transport system substrate-binding protein